MTTTTTTTTTAPTHQQQLLLLRSPLHGVTLHTVTKTAITPDTPYTCHLSLTTQHGPAKRVVNSVDGDMLMLHDGEGNVQVWRRGELVQDMKNVNAAYADLSPQGNFVTTWVKPDVLTVFSSRTGKPLMVVTSKKQNSTLQWTTDEAFAAQLEPGAGGISFFRPDGEGFVDAGKARLDPPCTYFALSSSTSSSPPRVLFAAFQPGGKSGKPAMVSLCAHPGGTRIASASTFRGEEASFRWSPNGAAVLCKVESAVDATGQSYYGESKLFLLLETPPVKGGEVSVNIIPPKEGAIHDYQWSPRGDVFCISAGKSPPRCTLFNLQGEGLFEFGEAPRNTICFNPHGRFLVLGGFGNLPGDLDFWQMGKKCKKLGTLRAETPPVTHGWSPDGRIFMTATLAPRMNVDNGVALYTYRGEKLAKWKCTSPELGEETALYECRWQAVPKDVFPDTPPSPVRGKKDVGENDDGTVPAATATTTAAPPAVYRPKGATGKIAEMMQGNRVAAGKYVPLSQRGDRGVPGATLSMPSAAAPVASKPIQNTVPGANFVDAPVKPKKKKSKSKGGVTTKEEEDHEDVAETEQVPVVMPPLAKEEETEAQKQIRKLKKIVKQIDEIVANGGPKNPDQQAKLGRRPELERQIAELEKM